MIMGLDIPNRICESFKLGVPDSYEDDNFYMETDEISLKIICKNNVDVEEEDE